MLITMSKSIKVLDQFAIDHHKNITPEVIAALTLSISTMRTVQYIRKGGEWSFTAPLHGEELEES